MQRQESVKKGIAKIVEVDGNDVRILDEAKLKSELIDDLIYTDIQSGSGDSGSWHLPDSPRRRAWALCPHLFNLSTRQWDEES